MTKNVVQTKLGVILILVAIYFLQVATPLRLHPDTVVLLSVAETAAHGGGYLYHGQPTVFPPGYPTLLALLNSALYLLTLVSTIILPLFRPCFFSLPTLTVGCRLSG